MEQTQPNILIIAVHDLGTRLGCYGYSSTPSPLLDRFADEGARFTRNFCTAPYCSPSRGSIITGKYPHVNGLMGLVNLGWDWNAENLTLAKALGAQGYSTHLFGFQHEASDEHVDSLGFQHVSERSLSFRCSEVAPLAADFLARQSPDDEQPFYVRVGFSECHRTFNPSRTGDPSSVSLPIWTDDTEGARADFAEYDGVIGDMDSAVGEILAALDGAGLRENTIVVFTTDHGSPFPGAKATLYDAGINTALLMRWPAGFSGGRVYSEMVSSVDLFPTLLEAVNADIPDDIQGRSFLPLLMGGAYNQRDCIFAGKNTQAADAKRSVRTDRYKYIRNYNPGPELMLSTDAEISLTRRDMGNAHTEPRPEAELYDLQEDPEERHNLAGKPETASVEKELAEKLRAIQEETSDPLLRGPVPRPEAEWPTIQGIFERAIPKCTYPRDGLLAGYAIISDPDRVWEFAEPRARF